MADLENYIFHYYHAQDVTLCIDELERFAHYDDYFINKNLRYHPNCTYELKHAIKSIEFIKW